MGGAVSAGVDNDELVDNLKAANYIRTPLLERVFRAVDRGDYFTSENRELAYRDNAWKKGNLHLSAPCIYAKVMEGLQLAPGQSFLNLGSGTGYLSTMAGLILGPYGINHGVELHADVVNYGQERLENFKKHSAAIDAFTFCDPQFVQGNCLCLPPDMRLYDRVYCGASCPESHENYMKGLINEGGILVMPLNDQLVKITRTGPSTWEVVSLLPVSFSSLVMPDSSHPPSTVNLPAAELMDLQEICRQELRSILRSNIEREHPNLVTAANRPVQRQQRSRDRRQICRIVVPYAPPVPFYESDDDPRMMSDDEPEDRDDRDTLYVAQRHTANQISAVIELARSLAGQRRLERENEGNEARQNDDDERDEDVDGLKEEEQEEEEDEEEDEEEEEDEVDDTPSSPGNGKMNKEQELFGGLTRMSFLKDKSRKEAGVEEEEEEEEEVEEGGVVVKGGESAETQEGSSTSVLTMPQSDPIPMTSTPATSVKSNKKREKFDSGVGDEIENGKGPSSESDAGDEDIDMDIDSTLSLQCSGWRQGRPGAASRAVSSAPEAAAGSRLPRPTAEIPGPRRWPLLGSLPALTTRKDWDPKRIHSVWDELSKEFGPVFRLDLPGQGHRIFISDPKDIEHLMKETSYMPTKPLFDVISTVRKQSKNVAEGQTGLLSEQGEEWWRLRRLTQPHTMKVKTVAHYLPEIDLVATEFLDRLPEVLDENNEIPHDFLQELFKWALETIGLTTFSKRIGCLSGSDEGLNLIRTIQSLLKGVHECQLEPGALWRWIPTPAYTKFKAANDALEEYTLAAISDAQLKLEQSDLQNLDLLGQVLLTPGLSKQDVLVFMLDFLIAGIDNVSTTVAFTMLNLAQHPEKQAKMQAELDQALGDGAQVLTPALLNQLSFTKACVRETLRLSPVSVALPRKLEHDVVLGGYLVPKGFEVPVLLKASGTREDAFPRAQEFLPERWLRGEGGRVSSYASLPFGIGTRMCIGKRFAEMEIYALLARMFHRFDVSWHHGAVGTQTRFLLMPDRPLNFTFTKRT